MSSSRNKEIEKNEKGLGKNSFLLANRFRWFGFGRKGAIRFIYVRSGLEWQRRENASFKTPPIGAAAAEVSRQFNGENEEPQLGLGLTSD